MKSHGRGQKGSGHPNQQQQHQNLQGFGALCGADLAIRGRASAHLDCNIFSFIISRRVRTGTPYLAALHTVEQTEALNSALSLSAQAAAAFCSDLRACKELNAEEKPASIAVSLDLAHMTPFVHASLGTCPKGAYVRTYSDGGGFVVDIVDGMKGQKEW